MELNNSFEILLRSFSPVFTEPIVQTFRLLMTGWILSFRHRYVIDLIVSSDSVGNGATIFLAGDDTLCRKRGLGIFGTGMHHDPLSSSKSLKVCHWGHDWVNICILISNPWWAPSKVFALPICMRLYRNRQGLTKGKRKSKKVPRRKPKRL